MVEDEFDGSNRRRRSDASIEMGQLGYLDQIPGRLLLQRLAIPFLAVSDDGEVLSANQAFAEMLGYDLAVVNRLAAHQIFEALAVDQPALPFIEGNAERVVRLCHEGDGVLPAVMSRSIFLRASDSAALMAFTDISELWWAEGRNE